MSQFQCVREDEQKLWILTPFPVTHNVWGFFIKDIFPKFSIDKSKISISDSEVQYLMKRWDNPKQKYLVREKNEDGSYKSCIADGEGFRWTHADLPDDKRTGLRVHDWGLIYIPNSAQFGYLDFISSDLIGNPESKAVQLSQINKIERETMKGLLLKLKGVLEEQPQPKIVEALRKKAMGLYGGFEWVVSYPTKEILGIGKLPLTSKNPMNTIEGQTQLDFYKNLDELLSTDPPYNLVRESYIDTAGVGWCMDAKYRHLSGEWVICPNLNEIEKHYPISRLISNQNL